MTAGSLITDFPAPWRQKLDALCGELELDVAGFSTRVFLNRGDLEHVYLPMLGLLENAARKEHVRVVAGLAGVPGSGKSTFAAILRHLASALIGHNYLAVAALDGWHWNNLVHERKRIRDLDGQMVPLKLRKGSTESFNATVYAEYLCRLRDPARSVALPIYDRTRHEPVPDAVMITPASRIILAEGNYLLAQTPPWDEVFEAIQPRFFLACDAGTAKQRVIARHIRGGCAPAEARTRYDRNDSHNAEFVLAGADHADYKITLTGDPKLVSLL